MENYVHGYSERESIRLEDQANTLDELLHHDCEFGVGELILEAGCGVGSQTKIIAGKNPLSMFTSIDISRESLQKAEETIQLLNLNNVEFKQADIFHLPFRDEEFDHVFVCFVLEHLADPFKALAELKRVLKPNGSITVIEGDHGSAFFYPDSKEAQKAIKSQIKLQKHGGGNSNIGRSIYPMLKKAGFHNISVSPRMVYADESNAELVEGFTKNTFTAMIEGVQNQAVANGLMTKENFEKGIKDLYQTAEEGGVFCYTFFKGIAYK